MTHQVTWSIGARIGLFGIALCASQQIHSQEVFNYRGLCDASAGVALGSEHFVVANDELNQLNVYKRGEAVPVGSLDVSAFLGTKKNKESDLEGAAAIGTRIYWISSHGRNKDGKVQERRYRFFATEIGNGSPGSLSTIGQPYAKLLSDLLGSDRLRAHKDKLLEASKLAPKQRGGLNIEASLQRPMASSSSDLEIRSPTISL